MKLSIVTVTYNSEAFLESCILSVINQVYNDIEYIIIDGSSTDGTMGIIRKYRDRISIVVSEEDTGIYDAMNKGIKLASGDIIGILNSDDFYSDPQVLGDVVSSFQSIDIDCLYGNLVYVDSADIGKVKRKWIAGKFRREAFLYGWMPPHPTFFVKRSLYQKLGLYNASFKISADYELMLRFLYKKRVKAGYIPRTLVKMRDGGISNSNLGHRMLANKEDRLAWKINEIRPYFFTFVLKPLRKIGQFVQW